MYKYVVNMLGVSVGCNLTKMTTWKKRDKPFRIFDAAVVILSWDFNGKIICKGVKWYDLSLFFVGLWTASKDQRLLWSSWLYQVRKDTGKNPCYAVSPDICFWYHP